MQSGLGSLLNNIHAIGARFGPGLPVEDRAPGVLPAPDPFPPLIIYTGGPVFLVGFSAGPASVPGPSLSWGGPGVYPAAFFQKIIFFRDRKRTWPPALMCLRFSPALLIGVPGALFILALHVRFCKVHSRQHVNIYQHARPS